MKLKLAAKISFLVCLPFLAFLGLAVVAIQGAHQTSKTATVMQKNGELFASASELIHEMQKERGKTALYLANSVTQSELAEQRQLSDQKVARFEKAFTQGSVGPSVTEETKAGINELHTARKAADSKEPSGEVIKKYTGAIRKFTGLESHIAHTNHLNGLEAMWVSLTVLETAKENLGRLRASGSKLLAMDKPLGTEDFTALQQLRAGVDANLASTALALSSSGQARLVSLQNSDHWKSATESYRALIQKASTGGFGVDPQGYFKSMTSTIDDMGTIVNGELAAVSTQLQAEKASAERSFWFLATLVGVITVVLGLLSVLVIRAITRPVNEVIWTLGESLESVKSIAGQLQNASHLLSSNSTEAASSMEETVASLEELSSMVTANAGNAQKAAKLSEGGMTAAKEGEEEIVMLIQAMGEIAQSSKKIEEIIGVIDDIAFQTNLLALNAAVEAARAGEQGKGFAVVSDAVRSLAQRSGAAAKEISSLIKDSVDKIERGSRIADASGTVLKQIVQAVQDTASLNTEIAAASNQQATGISQISKAMTQLDQTTQSNAASSEEVAAYAQTMYTDAEGLERLVDRLRAVVDGRTEIRNHGGQPTATATPAQVEKTEKTLNAA